VPMTLGSRPDNRTSEHTPQNWRMGPQALWGINTGMTSSRTDAVGLFESIFDQTKGRYS